MKVWDGVHKVPLLAIGREGGEVGVSRPNPDGPPLSVPVTFASEDAPATPSPFLSNLFFLLLIFVNLFILVPREARERRSTPTEPRMLR